MEGGDPRVCPFWRRFYDRLPGSRRPTCRLPRRNPLPLWDCFRRAGGDGERTGGKHVPGTIASSCNALGGKRDPWGLPVQVPVRLPVGAAARVERASPAGCGELQLLWPGSHPVPAPRGAGQGPPAAPSGRTHPQQDQGTAFFPMSPIVPKVAVLRILAEATGLYPALVL